MVEIKISAECHSELLLAKAAAARRGKKPTHSDIILSSLQGGYI